MSAKAGIPGAMLYMGLTFDFTSIRFESLAATPDVVFILFFDIFSNPNPIRSDQKCTQFSPHTQHKTQQFV